MPWAYAHPWRFSTFVACCVLGCGTLFADLSSLGGHESAPATKYVISGAVFLICLMIALIGPSASDDSEQASVGEDADPVEANPEVSAARPIRWADRHPYLSAFLAYLCVLGVGTAWCDLMELANRQPTPGLKYTLAAMFAAIVLRSSQRRGDRE